MKRTLPLTVATLAMIATALPGLPTAGAADQDADRAAAAQGRTRTAFAVSAVGYGTRVQGGVLPTGSGTTAYRAIGCTNIAGLSKRNSEASVTIPEVGVLSGVATRVWTARSKGVVSSSPGTPSPRSRSAVVRWAVSSSVAWSP